MRKDSQITRYLSINKNTPEVTHKEKRLGIIDLEFTHAHKETNGTRSVTMYFIISIPGEFFFPAAIRFTLRQPRIIPLYPSFQWSNYRDNGIRDTTTLKSDTFETKRNAIFQGSRDPFLIHRDKTVSS